MNDIMRGTCVHLRLGVSAFLLWILAAASVEATRYHVAVSGGDDVVNDGFSWDAPFATISNALWVAGDGDTIMLSNGTYNITFQIDLTNAVTFTSTNGWQYTTVDAGNVGGRRAFYMTNAAAVLDGVTVTRGNANNGSVPAQNGGAVWMSAGRVRNCLLTNNVGYPYGGDLYMAGGTVSNCVLAKGNASYHQGGGAYINGSGALLVDSTIRDNKATREGGGISISSSGGTVRNCVISENHAPNRSNGAIIMSAGLVENCLIYDNTGGNYFNRGTVSVLGGEVRYCTIADNESAGTSGGIWMNAGTVRNCIAYNNKLSTGADADVVDAGGEITYCCAPDLVGGIGNTTGEPEFENRATDDYRLAPGSAAIDAGTNIAGIAVDLEGSARPADGDGDGSAENDMGCYEAAAADSGVFRCSFSAPVTEANASLNAQFTAVTYGPQTNGLYYWWDYDSDGTPDEEGSDKRVVTHLYGPGTYSVSLTVSNDNDDVTSRTKISYITVFAAATYAATNGSHESPYATWATAATNIQDAVDGVAEGGTVTVSNGTYIVNENISLAKDVTVESLNGAPVTIVKKGSATTRLFSLTHSNAVIDGFTLLDGISPAALDRGGGVYMTDGEVRNCVITNCDARLGGGVYMEDGLVTNCVFADCSANRGGNSQAGGGVWMSGGLVTHCDMYGGYTIRAASGIYMSGGELHACTVHDNSGGWGAAVFMESGASVMKNCLITDNLMSGNYRGGGGVYMNHASARILNSTICDNSAVFEQGGGGGGTGGGGVKCVSGVISNSIIYYNTITSSGADDNIGGTTGTNNVRYSCSPDLINDPTGTGNITAAPGFTDRSSDDYSLGGGSPCIDTGATLADVVDDIAGTTRPQNGDGVGGAAYDMGAYEAPDAGAGPLSVNFIAPVTSGGPTLEAVFTASATGNDNTNLYYWWDFDFDGTPDSEGLDKGVVTNLYTSPGVYTVSLTASNASNEVDTETKPDYITVLATTTYVATNGSHTAPFTNWVTAATNVQDAIDAVVDGGTVWVSNGTYVASAPLSLTKGSTIRSLNGAAVTTITRGSANTRLFGLGHTNAVLDDLTLLNGYAQSDKGGGVNMTAGTIRNCIVTNCYAQQGGGVYMSGGLITNCTLTECHATGGNPELGGGVYMSDGLVIDCSVLGNTTVRAASGVYMAGGQLERCLVRGGSGGWGAAVYMVGPTMTRNCLITGNEGGGYGSSPGDGGGIRMTSADAHVENCTIVGNYVAAGIYGGYGGGINIRGGGTVTNCIVYYNDAALGGDDIYVDLTATNIGYTCTPDLPNDPSGSGNITALPQFVDAGSGYGASHTNGDYHPITKSPCLNAGVDLPWTGTGIDLDLGPRTSNGRVDMGAYEIYMPPPGTVILMR